MRSSSSLNRRFRAWRRSMQRWLRTPSNPRWVPDYSAFWHELQRQAPDLCNGASQFQFLCYEKGDAFRFCLRLKTADGRVDIDTVATIDRLKMMRDPAEEIVGELVRVYWSRMAESEEKRNGWERLG